MATFKAFGADCVVGNQTLQWIPEQSFLKSFFTMTGVKDFDSVFQPDTVDALLCMFYNCDEVHANPHDVFKYDLQLVAVMPKLVRKFPQLYGKPLDLTMEMIDWLFYQEEYDAFLSVSLALGYIPCSTSLVLFLPFTDYTELNIAASDNGHLPFVLSLPMPPRLLQRLPFTTEQAQYRLDRFPWECAILYRRFQNIRARMLVTKKERVAMKRLRSGKPMKYVPKRTMSFHFYKWLVLGGYADLTEMMTNAATHRDVEVIKKIISNQSFWEREDLDEQLDTAIEACPLNSRIPDILRDAALDFVTRPSTRT